MKYTVAESRQLRTVAPSADVQENEHSFVILIDMPALAADEIEVQFENERLTVRGTPKHPPRPREAEQGRAREGEQSRSPGGQRSGRLLLREFEPVSYARSFRIGAGMVESDAIDAQYHNGVLRLELPKSQAMRPRRVEVHAS